VLILAPLAIWRTHSLELLSVLARGFRHPDDFRPALSATAAFSGALASCYLLISLVPETGYDALVFHMSVPWEHALHGRWHFDSGQMLLSMLPTHAQSVYTIGFSQGGEAGARLMNTGFLIGTGIQIFVITRLYSRRYAIACALLAIALFLSTPLTFTEGSHLFVESPWALYTVTAIGLTLRRLNDARDPSRIIVCGLLLAGAIATKPQAIVTSAAVVLTILPVLLRDFPMPPPTRVVGWIAVILAVALHPYARSWILTGNPVFPFFNQHFMADGYPSQAFVDGRWLKQVSWSILYDLQFHSNRFMEGVPGVTGFQWLVLLPACAAAVFLRRSRAGLLLLCSACLMVISVFVFVRYLRYVFPALCVCTPLIGIGVSAMGPTLSRIGLSLGCGCVAMNLLFLPAASHTYRNFPITAAFSDSARQRHVEANAPVRKAVQAINSLNTLSRPVAFLCDPFGAGCVGKPLYDEWYNQRFNQAVGAAGTSAHIAAVLCSYGVEYFILSDSWRTPDRRRWIEAISDPVARFGRVQVRRLHEDLCLSAEVLLNPEFSDAESFAWNWTGSVAHGCGKNGGVRVSESSHGSQTVPAEAGNSYALKVTAVGRSDESICRAQIVWHDHEAKIIKVDLETFPVSTVGSTHTMRGVVPENAVSGLVYATGHVDSDPVCVTSMSLRWRQ
jgi:hypothetical protein